MKSLIKKHYRRALTIAGSDSGGGAGIQADLKTFSALGCFGMSVITAVTAQNTLTVNNVYPIPPEMIAQQIDAVFTDIGTEAVKIGMLFSSEVIEVVAHKIKKYAPSNIVLDPVMVAQSGNPLMQNDAIRSLKSQLIPFCLLITPNLPEAESLLGYPIQTLCAMQSAAKDIASLGPGGVLIKGGHLKEEPGTDLLYLSQTDNIHIFKHKAISTVNNHGTGCTLSSAIAAHLAHGNDIKTAVKKAKDYLSSALEAGAVYRLGNGHGPVHHFFNFWD